ncbi:MAG: hypothetical protein IKO38_10965 [Erysipelotrichaceae bacterium]|nr:hypothetical protein [Erysipelotrichaceae bacterium]
MWPYKEISRKDFESIKDHIEELMIARGAEPFDIELPYAPTTTSLIGDDIDITYEGYRRAFKYGEWYYRVDEVCFPEKPFIVFEFGTYDDLMNNTMEDIDPFPYDLDDKELEKEVSYAFMEDEE